MHRSPAMAPFTRWLASSAAVLSMALMAACSDSSSGSPTSPDAVLSSLSISGSTSFSGPGQTSQLSAVAGYSNNSTQNVTATAVWQTSNAQVAVVSGGGLLTARRVRALGAAGSSVASAEVQAVVP